MTRQRNQLSIIVVNFNSNKHLYTLINSLFMYIPKIICEIIVIDNNSIIRPQLNSIPKVKLVLNKFNLGFSKAVNQGIELSKSKHILLLNPDCYINNTNIYGMYSIFIKKNIDAMSGNIIDPITNKTKKSITRKPKFINSLIELTNLKKLFKSNFFLKNPLHNKIEIFSFCGAFILFNKFINSHRMRFDEDYFLYLEDVQFGFQLRKANSNNKYYPKASIFHHSGKSSNDIHNINLNEWYKSRNIFFQKNFSIVEYCIYSTISYFEHKILKLYHYLKNEPTY